MNIRPIKFRGKQTLIDKEELVYGWGCYTDEGKRFFIIAANQQFIEVECIQEYAGSNDKNGRPIYEGDFVKVFEGSKFERIDEVVFSGGFFTKKGSPGSSIEYGYQIEVIGNIYDNPELII